MAKLYIFVGVYDGIADEISLHLTEEAAEAAYTKYTGVPYVNPLTDQSNADPNTVTEPEISEHVNASTIEDVDLGCELAWYRDPDYSALSCSRCGNTKEFIEFAYRDTKQPFNMGEKPGLEKPQPDWDLYEFTDGEEVFPTEIWCNATVNGDKCGNVVWRATSKLATP